jgi:hypothetical protein
MKFWAQAGHEGKTMKYSLLSVNSKIGAENFATTKRWARLIMVCATLVVGSLAARAAGPILTTPDSVTIGEDTFTDVAIGVTDGAVPIFTVTTVATSSNTNLVSNASLVFSGFGTNRLLSITPGLHQSGTATITVIATDSQPSSTTNIFTLNVTFTNYPPVFNTSIANQTNNENATSLVLPFSVFDIQTPGSNLIISATSSNTSLVANSNLVISGTGTNCTLTVNQTTNQNGTTLIELVVTDSGGDSATNEFLLDVWAVNQPPTFSMATNLVTYNEYFGAVTLPGFISGVSSGPANQSSESNWFVLQYPTNFFAQPPVQPVWNQCHHLHPQYRRQHDQRRPKQPDQHAHVAGPLHYPAAQLHLGHQFLVRDGGDGRGDQHRLRDRAQQ